MEFDLVVTRHKGLVEYLIKKGIVGNDINVTAHANRENVLDKNVIGVLPHSLSCLAKSFSEIPLNIPQEMRGKELTCHDVESMASDLVTYMVEVA
jgi:putative CRISPR-associated protein (TIGR02620 family)